MAAAPSTTIVSSPYAAYPNGPDKEFTYVRVQPVATTGSASTDPAALVPSAPTPGNYAQPIILEFASATDDAYPGNQLLVVNRDALRQPASDLVKGFAIAGDRNSGGGIEVRSYERLSDGTFSAVGTLIPCRVDYAAGHTPVEQREAASIKTQLVLTPATLSAGRSLWKPGAKIVCDVQPILPTKVVEY